MKRLLGLFCVVLLCTAAKAATVDFNNYSPLNTLENVLSSGGLTFTAGIGNGVCPAACQFVWDSSSPNSNGTPGLVYAYGDPMTITRTSGGAFNLNSFDMSISWYDSNPSELIDVIANFAGGGSTSETLTLGQGLQTFDLNLVNLTSLTLSEAPGGYWLMDNVNYSATPEPGSLLLLGTGIAGIAAAIRRRAKA